MKKKSSCFQKETFIEANTVQVRFRASPKWNALFRYLLKITNQLLPPMNLSEVLPRSCRRNFRL